MSALSPAEAAAAVNAFLLRALDDREGDGLRPLAQYQCGIEAVDALIAREYAALLAVERSIAAPEPEAPAVPATPLSLEDYLATQDGDELELAADFAHLIDGGGLPDGSGGPTGDGRSSFGPYQLLGEIGRGGQGIVLIARDTRLPRVVALKLLHARDPELQQAFNRFRREADIASKLDHPGICTVYETGIIEGVPFIAMRWVDGETLSALFLRRGSAVAPMLPNRERIREFVCLLEQTARALHQAHEAGIVHRDVKPSNIIVTKEGVPVLVDFGLAREDAGGATVTLSGAALGTPAYVCPEQLSAGTPARTDRRADIWSLGVVLFEAVCGRRPFEAPTREGLYRAILAGVPPSPRRCNPLVSRDLQVIINKALEKNRDRRYPTALALAEDLRRFRQHEPVLAQAPSVWIRLARWAERKPAAAVAIALLVAGSASSTAFAVKASMALRDWTRLADGRRLSDLLEEAEQDLWPAVPAKVPAMEAWVGRARKLTSSLPDHAAELNALRSKALPYSAEAQAADRTADIATSQQLEEVANSHRRVRQEIERATANRDAARQRAEALEARVSAASQVPDGPEAAEARRALAAAEEALRRLDERRAALALERSELEARVPPRRTWSFEDRTEQFRHDQLQELVEGLEALHGPETPQAATIKGMGTRIAAAERLLEAFEGPNREQWTRCIADIARPESRYEGLRIHPVPGLVPLGRDRDSDLWEFWHMASGERPQWRAEDDLSGRVILHADSGAEGMVLVLLPGGSFYMGARPPDPGHPAGSPNVDVFSPFDNWPVHPVPLAPFFIAKYEVTQRQWMEAWRTNPSYLQAGQRSPAQVVISGRHPVTNVDWAHCQQTCRQWDLTLPTEAQWEYACRAGTRTCFSPGDDLAALLGFANLGDQARKRHYNGFFDPIDDGYPESAPVGSLRANAFGLHDLHGNVTEWCLDGYHDYFEWPARPENGFRGPMARSRFQVTRGGSYVLVAVVARSAARFKCEATVRLDHAGFRAARRLAP